MGEEHPLILPHGGYRKLRSFQRAQQVYDATVIFCNRLVEKRSRTHDQMVQAARSGVQNIAEGSMATATSKKIEINQASFLLDRQLQRLEQQFLETGGFTERLYRERQARRRDW